MDMSGERRISAPREKVWAALNDPEVLKASIPGRDTLEKLSDTELKATASVKIGPIAAKFAGKVQLLDLDPPNGYRIEGEGQGGVAGFAKGGASVRLAQDGTDTILSYDVKANVGGKIAQLGARLIDATAKQMADAFFDRFAAQVTTAEPAPAAEGAPAATAAPAPAPAAAPTISLLDLIPREPAGLPIVAWIGIALFVPVALMLLKGFF
jgi:carbon monoxide dehydrogenase subunit G